MKALGADMSLAEKLLGVDDFTTVFVAIEPWSAAMRLRRGGREEVFRWHGLHFENLGVTSMLFLFLEAKGI